MTGPLVLLALAVSQSDPVFVDREVAFGDDPLQAMDVYASLSGDDRPVFVVVHGGGWRAGDKRSAAGISAPLAGDGGIVMVSVNYRLVPKVGWREQAADVAAATAKAIRVAPDYGGDANRVYLVGHSAGAHLAALVATDPQYLAAHGLWPANLSGVILLDGAGYDVPAHLASAGATASQLYNSVFGDDPSELDAASPARHASVHGGPPMLIAHVADRPASAAQAKTLANAVRSAGGNARVLSVDGTHSSIYREFGHGGDPVIAAARDYFDLAD